MQHQQCRRRVVPTVTSPVSWQQGSLDEHHGFALMHLIAAREDIIMDIDNQSPLKMTAPELPSSPASELVTLDTFGQTFFGDFGFVVVCHGC